MHKLTITDWYNWKTMTLEFHNDSSWDDMKDIFQTIMTFLTFTPQERLEHNE